MTVSDRKLERRWWANFLNPGFVKVFSTLLQNHIKEVQHFYPCSDGFHHTISTQLLAFFFTWILFYVLVKLIVFFFPLITMNPTLIKSSKACQGLPAHRYKDGAAAHQNNKHWDLQGPSLFHDHLLGFSCAFMASLYIAWPAVHLQFILVMIYKKIL